ncbi:hypothetical protein LCGC14_0782950 [marine sediment metagenome]|uniref:Carbohydrate-binding/sugar hydrolysis domain-containing protein n=1 Tax=marine sediment metagenome TaxID=412755 RepID=A0A0F9T1Z1_9ZZZZ
MDRKNLRLTAFISLFIALFFILSITTMNIVKAESPDNEPILRYGMNYGPSEIDPHNAWEENAFIVFDQVVETLFTNNYSDPDLPVIPSLAADFGVWSSNGFSYTVSLKTGIEFHDGYIFNATSVKWSFDRLAYFMNITGDLPPQKAVTIIDEIYRWDGNSPIIESVDIIDEFTVTFNLNYPFVALESLLCFSGSAILSPMSTPATDYIDKYSGILVGTGPFVFDHYTPDVEIKFSAFENYWREPAQIKTLYFSIISDTIARENALLAGNIDFISNPSTSMLSTFGADPNLIVDGGSTTTIYYLGMNNKLYNRTWRKAISYAINYDYMINELLENNSVRLKSPLPEGVQFADDYFDVPTYNLTTARGFMQSMGFGVGFSTDAEWDAVAVSSDPFLEVNFSYNLGNAFRTGMNALLEDNLRKIGIKVIDNGLDWMSYLELLLGIGSPTGQPQFDKLSLWIYGWNPEYNDPITIIDPLLTNVSIYNGAQVNDLYLGQLMALGTIETDSDIRGDIYNELQRYVVEDLVPWAFLYSPIEYVVYHKNITGYQWNNLGRISFYELSVLDSGPVTDTTPPNISVNYYDTEANFSNGFIYIEAEVFDNIQLDLHIQIEFYNPIGILIDTINMSSIGGNTFSANWSVNSYAAMNNYYFTIYAYDNSSNLSTETQYFNIIEDTPEPVEYWILSPFIIDDNGNGDYTWAQAVNEAWCSGSGTINDPYIIENISINANGFRWCLTIENSNEYFVIRNSVFYNNSPGVWDSAVFLNHTYNGIIEYNDISYNNGSGILLIASENNLISENIVSNNQINGIYLNSSNSNIISMNEIKNNGAGINFIDSDSGIAEYNNIENNSWGILLYNSNYVFIHGNTIKTSEIGLYAYMSMGCEVIENSIENHTLIGIFIAYGSSDLRFYNNRFTGSYPNAYDDGFNSIWDNGVIGNYWDDYSGEDLNNDGIGDTPYIIYGSSGSMDNFPLWDDGPQPDLIPPNISSIYYWVHSIEGKFNLTIYAEISDDIQLQLPIVLEINYPNGTVARISYLENIYGNIFYYNKSIDLLPTGLDYYFTIYANDTSGNVASETMFFDIDKTPPTTNITLDGIPGINGWYISSVNVTLIPIDDLVGVNHTWYNLDGGSFHLYNGPILISKEGLTTINYFSVDNNWNQESILSKQVYINYTSDPDTSSPEITITFYDDEAVNGTGTISVSAIITDNILVQEPVIIKFYDPVGIEFWSDNMTGLDSSNYIYSWNVSSSPPGYNYSFIIFAYDISNNLAMKLLYFDILELPVPSGDYELEWYRLRTGEGTQGGFGVAVDSSGNTYQTGYTMDGPHGRNDLIIIKTSTSGLQLWSRTFGGAYDDIGFDVAIDSLGFIYIVGTLDSYPSNSDEKILILKYDNTGNLIWNKTWDDIQNSNGRGLVIDSEDNLIVVGYTNGGVKDMVIIKYNNSGAKLWEKTWGGSGYEGRYGLDVAVDSQNNIFVVCQSSSISAGYGFLKYNSFGDLIWEIPIGGAIALAVDSNDSVYIGGQTSGYKLSLKKYSNSGNNEWSISWGGSSNYRCRNIAIDSKGNVFLGATKWNSMDEKFLIVMFNNSGSFKWEMEWGSQYSMMNEVSGITIDIQDSVYISGYIDYYDGVSDEMVLLKFSKDIGIIFDTTSPEIEITHYNTEIIYGSGISTINASIFDGVLLQEPVIIKFFTPIGTEILFDEMSEFGTTVHQYSLNNSLFTIGNNYYFTIYAYDNSGNAAFETRYFDIISIEPEPGYWTLTPFVIDEYGGGDYTWGEVVNEPWCSGSGTSSDPYIIENITINSNWIGSSIEVKNSNVYFIIRNSTFLNAGSGSWPDFDAGIKLVNTINALIINNYCKFNLDNGIFLYNSDYNQVIGNIAYNNDKDGIYLYRSFNNLISKNHLTENVDHGIYIREGNSNQIIENFASENRNGIYIYRGNYNGLHRNIFFRNTQAGIYFYGGFPSPHNQYNSITENIIYENYNGISLSLSDRNQILNNNIFNNSFYGITLHGTVSLNQLSGNVIDLNYIGIYLNQVTSNTINGNIISNSIEVGVRIINMGGGYSADNNLFYENSFIDNGINAIDDGVNNQWENGIIGNYWDDYIGVDTNDDGIGDSPHYIPGWAGSTDNLPIWDDGPGAPDYISPITNIDCYGNLGLNGWYISEVNFTLSVFDENSGVNFTEYSFDGISWITYSGFFLLTSEGNYTIFYRSVDNEGNIESIKSFFLQIDLTSPTTFATLHGVIGYRGWYISNINITFLTEDLISGINFTEYSTDGNNWINANTSVILTIDGNVSFYYRSIDYAGNTEIIQSLYFGFDLSSPLTDVNLEGDLGLNGLYTSNISVNLSTFDNFSGVNFTEYSFDAINWVIYNSPFFISQEGLTTVYYRSIDNVGNIEDYSSVQTKIDKDSPETTISFNKNPYIDNWYEPDVFVSLIATDDSSGILHSEYSYDGINWISYSIPFNIPLSGQVNIYYRSVDNAGNLESFKISSIKVIYTSIVIDDLGNDDYTWAEAVDETWCTGSGTWSDPYIIENIIVSGEYSKSSIEIRNSEVFFIIQNSLFYASGFGSHQFYDYEAGINLANVTNSYIINNTFSDNNGAGIFLYLSNNNTVSGNIINGAGAGALTGHSGIYLLESHYNFIMNNNANNNSYDGISMLFSDNNVVSGNIANYNEGDGIFMPDSNNNMVSGNTLNHNWQDGIYASNSHNNTFLGNIANYNGAGIVLWSSDNNTVSGNTANNNGWLGGIYIRNGKNNMVSGNTANDNDGFGIYLKDSVENFIMDNNANYNNDNGIYLQFSNNNMIVANNASDTGHYGIVLEVSDNNNIMENNANYNYYEGIYLYLSDNNVVSGNTANNNEGDGIYIYNSDYNTILGNTANYNDYDGIYIPSSDKNTIFGNTANYNNWAGITLSNSHDNAVSGNNVSNNEGYGIYFDLSNNNTVSGNSANNNKMYGIFIQAISNENLISGNNIIGNGIFIQNSYSNIIRNNIITNGTYISANSGIYLQFSSSNLISGNLISSSFGYGLLIDVNSSYNEVSDNIIMSDWGDGITIGVNSGHNVITRNIIIYNWWGIVIEETSNNNLIYNNYLANDDWNAIDMGLNNSWDNGTIGNYWNDYTGVDSNDDGIGDTPYNITGLGGSIDHFPIWDDGKDVFPPGEYLEIIIDILLNLEIPEETEHLVEKAILFLTQAKEKFDKGMFYEAYEKIGDSILLLMAAGDMGANTQEIIDSLNFLTQYIVDTVMEITIDIVGEDNKFIIRAQEDYETALLMLDLEDYDQAVKFFKFSYRNIMKARGKLITESFMSDLLERLNELQELQTTNISAEALNYLQQAENKLLLAIEKVNSSLLAASMFQLKEVVKGLLGAENNGVNVTALINSIIKNADDVAYQKLIETSSLLLGESNKHLDNAWNNYNKANNLWNIGKYESALNYYAKTILKTQDALK